MVMPAGFTIDGVPSSVMPMKPTDTPWTFRIVHGRQDRLAGVPVDGVRREVGEVGAEVRVAVLAAVDRVAATVLQPQELCDTLVELVVADRGDVHPQQVERLDRGLVMEGGAQQRGGADHVAGADRQRLLALGSARPAGLERGGEVLRTAGGYAVDRAAAAARGVEAPWKSLKEKNRALATSPRPGSADTEVVGAATPATASAVAARASRSRRPSVPFLGPVISGAPRRGLPHIPPRVGPPCHAAVRTVKEPWQPADPVGGNWSLPTVDNGQTAVEMTNCARVAAA